jgi:hypothetical protein
MKLEPNGTGWAVVVNADGTEGRGPMVVPHVCEVKMTAIRMAKGKSTQGADGDVIEVGLYRAKFPHGEEPYMSAIRDYGPIRLVSPTKEDDAAQKKLDARHAAEAKARAAGLTAEDIAALRSTGRG